MNIIEISELEFVVDGILPATTTVLYDTPNPSYLEISVFCEGSLEVELTVNAMTSHLLDQATHLSIRNTVGDNINLLLPRTDRSLNGQRATFNIPESLEVNNFNSALWDEPELCIVPCQVLNMP